MVMQCYGMCSQCFYSAYWFRLDIVCIYVPTQGTVRHIVCRIDSYTSSGGRDKEALELLAEMHHTRFSPDLTT